MAIRKFKRNQSDANFCSKTQQKNDALALKKMGLKLTQLSVDVMVQLPVSEITLKSIQGYAKITTHLARKRHLMFIGKCLRSENETRIKEFLNKKPSKTRHDLARKKLNGNTFEQEFRGQGSLEQDPRKQFFLEQAPDEKDNREQSIEKLIGQLIALGDKKIEQLLVQIPNLQRQTLKQILRNIHRASEPENKNKALNKMRNYLSEHCL